MIKVVNNGWEWLRMAKGDYQVVNTLNDGWSTADGMSLEL